MVITEEREKMVSGMGNGPGPGQGSWPGQPQQFQSMPPQYPGQQYPGQPYPGQPQPPVPGQYPPGGRFPVAEPFDGVNPDGTPRIVRAQLDPREIPALTMYLTQAPVVLAAPGNAQDELVPSAGQAIPRAFHSDGIWVWPAAVGYYLGCYQLPPSDALLAHIRMRNYQLAFVPQETRSAAAGELMAILNAPAAPVPGPPAMPAPQQNQPGRPMIPAQPAVSGPLLSAQTVQEARSAQPAPQLPALPAPSPAPLPSPVPAAIVSPVAAVQDEQPETGASSESVEPESSAARSVGAQSADSPAEPADSAPGSALGSSPEAVSEPRDEQPAEVDDDPYGPTVLWTTAGRTGPAADSVEPTKLPDTTGADESNGSDESAAASAPAEPVDPSEQSGPTMVFSAAESKAQWASLDSSRPQNAAPITPERFGPEFGAAGNEHAAWVSEQLEAFTAYMPTGEWTVDHATRRYTQSERSLLVDGLGTLSPEGVWTWAWSEFGGWDEESGILDQSRVLRSLAERAQIAELTAGSVDLTGVGDAEDPAAAAEMLAWTAMGLLGARGYIGHGTSNGGRIYYLVTDPSVPSAEPSLGLIPRHLFEGTATFGEKAADCVIGYAEHHGWEWNRTPNGVGVTATGVGTFAVEIADDRLVGLTLRVP